MRNWDTDRKREKLCNRAIELDLLAMLLQRKGWKKIARTSNRTLDYDYFKSSFGDSVHQCRDKESRRFWHALHPYSGISTCQGCCRVWNPEWVGIYACTRSDIRVYTTHNIPGDPPQTKPRLVSHHCALWEFMNWKRIIALLTTWSLCDSGKSYLLREKFISFEDWSVRVIYSI